MLLSPYLKSILITVVVTAMGFAFCVVEDWNAYAFLIGPIIGLIISWKYTSTCVDSKQDRLLLLFLNPILYLVIIFAVFLTWIYIDGFHPWNY